MSLHFNYASPEDFKQLIILVNSFYLFLSEEKNEKFDAEKVNAKNKKYLRIFLTKSDCTYIICKRENIVIGYIFLSIEKDKEDTGYINELFVMPTERGSKVGLSLLEESIQWFKSKNCKQIKLEVSRKNKLASNLYKKLGFFKRDYDYIEMTMNI